jgi:hypothetical protein
VAYGEYLFVQEATKQIETGLIECPRGLQYSAGARAETAACSRRDKLALRGRRSGLDFNLVPLTSTCSLPFELALMRRIGERRAAREGAAVPARSLARVQHPGDHLRLGDSHLDTPAGGARVDRLVVAVSPPARLVRHPCHEPPVGVRVAWPVAVASALALGNQPRGMTSPFRCRVGRRAGGWVSRR